MANSAKAIGKPEGTAKFVSSIPIITGKIINAANALVLGMMKSRPATTSATPTNGISQLICIKAAIIFCKLSGKFFGAGR